MNDYRNITLAGFHMLHRKVWNEIVGKLKSQKPLTKPAAFFALGLPEDMPQYCFACAVSINMPIRASIFFSDCRSCPVTNWRKIAIDTNDTITPCCERDRSGYNADLFRDWIHLEAAINLYGYDELTRWAETIRDEPWSYTQAEGNTIPAFFQE